MMTSKTELNTSSPTPPSSSHPPQSTATAVVVTGKRTSLARRISMTLGFDTIGMSATAGTAATIDDNNNPSSSKFRTVRKRISNFYWTNEFLILILLAILLAFAYPPLGAIYVYPQITATWIAVIIIFLIAGLNLKSNEFANATKEIYFNLFVFVYQFGFDSAVVFGVSRFLVHYDLLSQDLANGMVIASCLPVTINMCVVMTKSSGGDEAAAIVNSALWNMVGVFLSPVLILAYLGVGSEDEDNNAGGGTMNRWTVFYKLALRVLLPIGVGQILRWKVPVVMKFVTKYKPYLKKVQIYSLVFIVYTIFCKTFMEESNSIPIQDIAVTIAFVAICLIFLMVVAWYLLRVLFKSKVKLRIMGLYGCTQKTAAMGIPLINALFEGSNPSSIGLYTLPLLIWHPMQLVIGTFLSPRLLRWVESFDDDKEEDEEEGNSNHLDVSEKKDGDEVYNEEEITPNNTNSVESAEV